MYHFSKYLHYFNQIESDISDLPNLEPAASDFANLRDHVLDAALSADLPGFNLVMEQENLLNEVM